MAISWNGIFLSGSDNANITGNTVTGNSQYGIRLIGSNNLIYNNYFNNTNNSLVSADSTGNIWNTTPTPGTNIIGGSYLGGNYWANPTGTGWSQTQPGNSYGFTTQPYTVNGSDIDQYPLTTNSPVSLLNSFQPVNPYYTFNSVTGQGYWVINQSGTYRYDLLLANNSVNFDKPTNTYTNFGTGFGLLINASNVILDGMGAVLNGGGNTAYGIIVNNQSPTNYSVFSSDPSNALGGISITNITLTGFTQAGIFFNNVIGDLPGVTTPSQITNVNASYNGGGQTGLSFRTPRILK